MSVCVRCKLWQIESKADGVRQAASATTPVSLLLLDLQHISATILTSPASVVTLFGSKIELRSRNGVGYLKKKIKETSSCSSTAYSLPSHLSCRVLQFYILSTQFSEPLHVPNSPTAMQHLRHYCRSRLLSKNKLGTSFLPTSAIAKCISILLNILSTSLCLPLQGRLLNLSCSTVPTFVLSITATTQVMADHFLPVDVEYVSHFIPNKDVRTSFGL